MKVAALIDGFNLYYSMNKNRFSKYKWLDFKALFREYVNSRDELEIHYFTTVNYEDTIDYKKDPKRMDEKKIRHMTLIEAERTRGVIVHYGRFEKEKFQCECGKWNYFRREKQTDVALGSHLIHLSFSLGFRKFIILSADTDLISAITLVRENIEDVRVDLLLPPGVYESRMSELCDNTFTMSEEKMQKCVFPRIVKNELTGEEIKCPDDWHSFYVK